MIFAISAAIQTASIATKALVVIGVVGTFASLCFYAGVRWEVPNTMTVQKNFDKAVSEYNETNKKLKADLALSNERRKSDKEITDVQIDHAIAGLVFYSDELRKSRQKSRSRPLFPAALPNTKSPQLACFDRAAADRADEIHREEEARITEEIFGIVEQCSARTIEFNGVKAWAQSLPKGIVIFN